MRAGRSGVAVGMATPKLVRAPRLQQQLGRRGQGLGGDAADVQAGAPDPLVLDEHRARAELRCSKRGHVPGRATAQHGQVELVGHCEQPRDAHIAEHLTDGSCRRCQVAQISGLDARWRRLIRLTFKPTRRSTLPPCASPSSPTSTPTCRRSRPSSPTSTRPASIRRTSSVISSGTRRGPTRCSSGSGRGLPDRHGQLRRRHRVRPRRVRLRLLEPDREGARRRGFAWTKAQTSDANKAWLRTLAAADPVRGRRPPVPAGARQPAPHQRVPLRGQAGRDVRAHRGRAPTPT